MPIPNRPPVSGADVIWRTLEQIVARLRRLEGRRTTAVGGWVLEEREDGALIARRAATGRTIVVAAGDPDESPS